MAMATLIFLLLTATILVSHADLNFIKKTCEGTTRPDFCTSVLLSVPRSINSTTVPDLTSITIDVAITEASNLLAFIQGLSDKNPGTPLEAALNQCALVYGSAVSDLTDARDDMGSLDFSGAASSVGTAVDAPQTCEGMFGDGVNSPISQRNQDVEDHCDLH